MTGRMRDLLTGGLLTGALLLFGPGAALAGIPPGASAHNHNHAAMSTASASKTTGQTSTSTMMGQGNSSDMMAMMSACEASNMTDAGGMMGSGKMMDHPAQAAPTGKSLMLAQAQQKVSQYIAMIAKQTGNKNLGLGTVIEFQQNFYASATDKSTGRGAFELLVNKVSGAVIPELGPNMMWNTTYGMMGHMPGYQQPSGAMIVTQAQARRIATQWVTKNQPGAGIATPEPFPGYYTIRILTNGKVTGLLSVNGYSGQVWSHTWHGAATQMQGAQHQHNS